MPDSAGVARKRKPKGERPSIAEPTLVLVDQIPSVITRVHQGKRYHLKPLDLQRVTCPPSSSHDYGEFTFEITILVNSDLRAALSKEKGDISLSSALFLTSIIYDEVRHFQVVTPPLAQYATLIPNIPKDLLFAALLLIVQTRAQNRVETLRATISDIAKLVKTGVLKRRKARKGTYVARVYAGEPEFSATPNPDGTWTPTITITRWPKRHSLFGEPASSERAAIAEAKELAEGKYRAEIRRFKASSSLLS